MLFNIIYFVVHQKKKKLYILFIKYSLEAGSLKPCKRNNNYLEIDKNILIYYYSWEEQIEVITHTMDMSFRLFQFGNQDT